jgi:serine/threonine protein kinase
VDSVIPTGPTSLDATFQGFVPLGTPDLTGLPLLIREELKPWWNGVGVYEAVDRRRKVDVLLVAFPKLFVCEGVENLRHTMGKYTGFGLGAVLTLHEVVRANDHILLLYEPFPGRPLSEALGERPLKPLEALLILQQICYALKEGQKVSITHQWLSPQTILVDGALKVKLVGLGLRDVLAKHDHTSRAYLSPEIIEGQEGSPAGDIFSFGLLGVELLQAFMPANWSPAILDPATVGWPSETEGAVPARVRQLLLQCLREDPMRRPSAAELYKGLLSAGLVPGQNLTDRYVIEGKLGRGDTSQVYRARDRQFAEEVAIKTMINLAADSLEYRERLFREVQICRKITHPNVVRVYDIGEFSGGLYIIMELLGGPGLDEVIEIDAPFSLAETRPILMEISAALAEAHRWRIVHRDLKPGHVILVDGRVKLIGFGLSRLSDEPQAWARMLTKLLAKNPEERYQTAVALSVDLAKLPV